MKIRRKPRCSAARMNALGAKLLWGGGLSGGVGLAEVTMLCVVASLRPSFVVPPSS